MLKQRIITALVLLPVVVLLVLFAPTAWLGVLFSALTLLAAWEWAALSGYVRTGGRILYCLLTAVWCAAVVLAGLTWSWDGILSSLCGMAIAWWLFALIWITAWRTDFPRPCKAFSGWLTLIPPLFAALALQEQRPVLLLLPLVLIWAADSGAYFAGRVFGRHKLAPAVSPGKTWEGVAGGTLSLLVVTLLSVRLIPPGNALPFILICMLTGWLSMVGDLSESLFKRQAGVKDSGVLFPGHGGVLDRIDSLTAAVPAFWLGVSLLGWLR